MVNIHLPDSLKLKLLLLKSKFSFWYNLSPAQKGGLVSLLFFLLILPLALVALTSPTNPFIRAQLPVTPPETPTPTPTPGNCPGPFSLANPPDGQIFPTDATGIVFRWNPSANAQLYKLYINRNEEGQPTVFSTKTPETHQFVRFNEETGIVPGYSYSWSVIAYIGDPDKDFPYCGVGADSPYAFSFRGQTPTPTPTPAANSLPVITTKELPTGFVGRKYQALVQGRDRDLADNLGFKFLGIPSGLKEGPCSLGVEENKWTVLKCLIDGRPKKAGTFYLVATLRDNRGGQDRKIFKLVVKKSGDGGGGVILEGE